MQVKMKKFTDDLEKMEKLRIDLDNNLYDLEAYGFKSFIKGINLNYNWCIWDADEKYLVLGSCEKEMSGYIFNPTEEQIEHHQLYGSFEFSSDSDGWDFGAKPCNMLLSADNFWGNRISPTCDMGAFSKRTLGRLICNTFDNCFGEAPSEFSISDYIRFLELCPVGSLRVKMHDYAVKRMENLFDIERESGEIHKSDTWGCEDL